MTVGIICDVRHYMPRQVDVKLKNTAIIIKKKMLRNNNLAFINLSDLPRPARFQNSFLFVK